MEWWHEHVRREYGACCQHHTPGPEERITVTKVQLDASIELEYPIHNRQIRKDYPRIIKQHTSLPEPEDEPYLSEDISIRVRKRNQRMPPRLVIVREQYPYQPPQVPRLLKRKHKRILVRKPHTSFINLTDINREIMRKSIATLLAILIGGVFDLRDQIVKLN